MAYSFALLFHDTSVANKHRVLTPADVEKARDFFTEEVYDGKRATQFQPGVSGNPGGRPPMPDVGLDDMLLWKLSKSLRAELAEALIQIAIKGQGHVQLAAIQYVFDRIEGKPRLITPPEGDEEPLIARILRRLIDDKTALEGRQLSRPALPLAKY